MSTLSSTDIVVSVRQAMAKAFSKIVPTLPALPDAGSCECGGDVFILISEGIAGVYDIQFTEDHWHSWTSGWDDIDDSPLARFVACRKCDKAYREPDDIDWN